MKKRIGSLLLILALCFTLLPSAAFAAETMDTWDGIADTSWYDENETGFHLKTAKQLAGMAKLVNDDTANFKDKTVYLDNDLDLGGHEWISIGDGANTDRGSFQGVFDGQSHVIYNLYSHEGLKSENKDNNNNLYRNGLFGSIYNATVKNLGIENADIVIPMNDTSTYGKGILVDWMTDSTINNCYTTGSITGGSYIEKYIGGIAGFLNGNNSISQCYSTAAITGNYDGEYYAEQEGGLKPMDCWDSLGGIVGASYRGQVTISDCWFGGEIVVNSIQAPVGGIIGFGKGVSMVNCLVATKGIGNDALGNTYWLGYVVNTDAKNCFWPADDRYGSNVSNEESGNSAGTATNDFNSDDVLVGLNANAAEGIEWVAGINHPTFAWDVWHIPADYTKFIGAIAAFLKEVETSPFSDVSTSAYYYEAVKWAQEKGITGGIGNGLFGPNQPCTRAQIVTFLWRAAGSPVVNYAMNMSDVPEGSYYTEAVRWALSEGITTGTTENTFSPDSECTRAQAVAFLFRYAASEAVTLQELVSGFSDADSVPGYALPAMNWALAEEIVQGNGSKLMPNDSCTRAQIVTFLFRAYQDK